MGAELAINYHEQDFANVVIDWTNGHGVDVILDIIGASYFEQNIEALAKDGRLLLVGFLSGEVAESINLLKIAVKRLTLTGSTMRSSSALEKAIIAEDLFKNVWPLLSAGKCLPVIHEIFPLARASDAHRMMESGKHIGKIVLHVSN